MSKGSLLESVGQTPPHRTPRPLFMGSVTSLTCVWFPESERTTATAIATTANGSFACRTHCALTRPADHFTPVRWSFRKDIFIAKFFLERIDACPLYSTVHITLLLNNVGPQGRTNPGVIVMITPQAGHDDRILEPAVARPLRCHGAQHLLAVPGASSQVHTHARTLELASGCNPANKFGCESGLVAGLAWSKLSR